MPSLVRNLQRAYKNDKPMFYSRDALSSGLVPVRTANILQSSKVFCDLINQIYKLPIKGLWFLFNKVDCTLGTVMFFLRGQKWRNLFTLGRNTKIMWFRCMTTKRQFGIGVPQCTLVMLSPYAADVRSDVTHCVTNGENSWLFAFEY